MGAHWVSPQPIWFVKSWSGAVFHIVQNTGPGAYALCGTQTSRETPRDEMPPSAKLCRRCRAGYFRCTRGEEDLRARRAALGEITIQRRGAQLMSHDGPATPRAERPDYTRPIARAGEEQFICVYRQRSGMTVGDIDFGVRTPDDLSERDVRDLVTSALLAYETAAEDLEQWGERAVVERVVEKLTAALESTSDKKSSEERSE